MCVYIVVQLGLSDAEFRVLERNEYAPVCCELFGATGKTVLVNITSNPGTAKGKHLSHL